MSLKKKTKINRLTIDTNRRIIFVSDIHGDVEVLQDGLKKIGFSKDDYLFVIGDIIEKGDFMENLKTLRFMVELSKNDNVFPMTGNCDGVFRFIKMEESKTKALSYILNNSHKSILNDIAAEMNYPINEDMDLADFIDKVYDNYPDLINFTNELNDVIIINDQIVLVHGGISDINNIPEYSLELLKFDRFYEKSNEQPKLMIVGHYPTRNYRADVSNCNPIFDFKKKIISIDGGNHVAKGGQLNFVILESLDSMRFSFKYFDHYPKKIINKSVNYNSPETEFNITFGDNEVEILDQDLDFYYIKHINTNVCMWVHTSYVYTNSVNNKVYCYDGSNHFISLNEGDEISIIKKAKPYSVVKKNGYIGLVETRVIEDDI